MLEDLWNIIQEGMENWRHGEPSVLYSIQNEYQDTSKHITTNDSW